MWLVGLQVGAPDIALMMGRMTCKWQLLQEPMDAGPNRNYIFIKLSGM